MPLAAAMEGERQLFMTSNRFNPADNLLRRYAVVLKMQERVNVLCKVAPPRYALKVKAVRGST
jgi:hypothetical protein